MYSGIQGSRSNYNRSVKKAVRRYDDKQLAIALVLEKVHPSHFGVLPPSPSRLLGFAMRKGLLSFTEVYG